MPNLHIQTLQPCQGRTLIIGDVHGCAEELATLVEAFSPRPQDRLMATGDLINRGPDSPAVLDLVRRHRIQCVLGNHEQRLLSAWQSGNPDLVTKSADKATLASLKASDWEWILTWPHVLRVPSLKLLVVHGGFAPGVSVPEQDPDIITMIQVVDPSGRPAKRSKAPAGRPWADLWNGPEHVIYGHTPRPHPLLHPHATGIDTGCVYGYTLTAVCFPSMEFYRVRARRRYMPD